MAERTVDVLLVRWYERRDRAPDVLGRWLRAAREHLPAAEPRRFGDTEPLRSRLPLAEAYARADPLLFLAGSPPVHHAALANVEARRRGPIAVHTLQAEVGPADERIRRFALALTHPGTVYVSASVERGLVLDRGTLYGPAAQPGEPYLAPHGDWLGLPPDPPAWCWFGPVYRQRVARDISGEDCAGGLFYAGGPWVRTSLQARPADADPARRRAGRLPRGLHRSPLRMIRDHYPRGASQGR
ncbi:hypothetical protein [Cryptosporangium aurantiacum]|uniref:Uncharacterized protein n=1 Tax=Cryptosporangium aurantiacum TaxID=134849 RepID=A0A1M7L2X7_9ACTN|nr:hypothetical protein [Cryptosporangium aurantiacum]SHM72193.1 hypothetical protein SAMN05443668_1011336 [Cryptosporangium aurantiacum]